MEINDLENDFNPDLISTYTLEELKAHYQTQLDIYIQKVGGAPNFFVGAVEAGTNPALDKMKLIKRTIEVKETSADLILQIDFLEENLTEESLAGFNPRRIYRQLNEIRNRILVLHPDVDPTQKERLLSILNKLEPNEAYNQAILDVQSTLDGNYIAHWPPNHLLKSYDSGDDFIFGTGEHGVSGTTEEM